MFQALIVLMIVVFAGLIVFMTVWDLMEYREEWTGSAFSKIQKGYALYRQDEQWVITCFNCGKTSYNERDVRERYCNSCGTWHGQYPDNDHHVGGTV